MKGPLGIVGLGAVGGAFASAAAAADGVEVVAWTRSYERREVWIRRPGVEILDGPEEVAHAAGVLLLAVTDGAIAEVAERCAVNGPTVGRCALHTAGGVGPGALGALAELGWATGVLHPLRPVVADDEEALAGAAFGLFGSPEARGAARELVGRLGGLPLEIDGEGDAQTRYHAAAALLSNGAVALFELAVAELEAAGSSPDEARAAGRSLLEHSAANLARFTGAAALTGPVRRGDVVRVSEHLAALSPEAAAVYRRLSRRLLALVEADLEPARAAALRQVLEAE